MAIAIERTPVLTGKAAEEFYERWAKMKDRRSKEEIEESMRRTKQILAKMITDDSDD